MVEKLKVCAFSIGGFVLFRWAYQIYWQGELLPGKSVMLFLKKIELKHSLNLTDR